MRVIRGGEEDIVFFFFNHIEVEMKVIDLKERYKEY